MANEQDLQMLKFWDTVDGQSWQKGPLGENQPSSNRDRHSKEKMGMAWPHIEKAKQQHYKTCLDVEPSGQQKDGEAKKHRAT